MRHDEATVSVGRHLVEPLRCSEAGLSSVRKVRLLDCWMCPSSASLPLRVSADLPLTRTTATGEVLFGVDAGDWPWSSFRPNRRL
jgi:hypothetical protein